MRNINTIDIKINHFKKLAAGLEACGDSTTGLAREFKDAANIIEELKNELNKFVNPIDSANDNSTNLIYMNNIKIYTDGACRNNPGPGGWAYVLSYSNENGVLCSIEESKGYRFTTNNRMELMAVIYGLQKVSGKGHDIEIISDSKYVCDAFNNSWIFNWKKNGWKRNGEFIPNADLWRELLELYDYHDFIRFKWIKGHNHHKLNEKCDKMAVKASKDQHNWVEDRGYERK